MGVDLVEALGARVRSVYVAVDGSPCGNTAVAVALGLAKAAGAPVTGAHAAAVRLHDDRFRQMEGGLPERFQSEPVLEHQREVHDTLIGRGLDIISDAYLDPVAEQAAIVGVPFAKHKLEGRNFRVLLDDICAGDADVVVLGRFGMAADAGATAGSVCQRIVRGLDRDVLVIGTVDHPAPFARVGVAVDGSAASLGALHAAIAVVKATGGRLELMTSFDPHFHYRVFHRVSGVLSEEAGRAFRFKDQERMHEEIIDDGLARIYRGHLDVACRVAEEAGVEEIGRHVLSGKAAPCVLQFAREAQLTALFLGRTGVHSDGDLALGGCAELLLATPDAPHVFFSARGVDPARHQHHEAPLPWTPEATERMDRVPKHVRGLAIGAIERRARDEKRTIVTSEIIDAVMGALRGGGSTAPAAPKPKLPWDAAALAAVMRLDETLRDGFTATVELNARKRGIERVNTALVDELLAKRAVVPTVPANTLPDEFVAWQCAARVQLFDDLARGLIPAFMPAHLPVLCSHGAGGAFPMRLANKGVGLVPRADLLPAYVERLWACLDRLGAHHDASNRAERIDVARALYDRPEDVDPRHVGTIEIFRGKTYDNLRRDPRAAILYTGPGPVYASWQFDCHAAIIGEVDPHFRFLVGMRLLFEQERFHIQQPGFKHGYLMEIAGVHDKTPHSLIEEEGEK